MKCHNQKQYLLTKAASLLMALALCISLVIPAGGITAYASTESTANEAEVTEESAAATETEVTEESAATTETEVTEESAATVETVISGYKTDYNKRYNEILEIEADIIPAGGREVQLQRYSSSDGIWTTIQTITEAEDADEDVVHVCFDVPAEERSRTSSQWRLFVPATENAAEAYSEVISVTTRNIEKYSLSARNACVYRIDEDGSGTMIYSKESKTEVAQASTTKLMTAVLLLESGLLDTTTTISYHAAETPWGSGKLEAGDVYNTKDLLYAMLLPSSNDAATAVAERVGGTEGAFVQRMNAKAEKMGWTQTHFRNPHGLDADGHYTTALELAKLTAYAYTFPEIRDCWGTQWKTIRSLKYGNKWTLWSTNAIFGYISSFLGGKTGTEDNAGCCFTGVYEYEGTAYVTVVLGSGYGFSRWTDTKKLHSYIRNYATSSY